MTDNETAMPELKIPPKNDEKFGAGPIPEDPMAGVAPTLKDVVEGGTNTKIQGGAIEPDPVSTYIDGARITLAKVKPWNGEERRHEMLRYNQGKPRASMIPPSFTYYTAMVLEYGAIKYERENWRKGCKWNDLIDSLQRHLDSFRAGEDCDDESTLPHLAHMAFNVMALIEFFDKGLGTDDRFRYPDQALGAAVPGRILQFRRPPGRE